MGGGLAILGTIADKRSRTLFGLVRRPIMFSKVDYVMVNVSDMARSVAFYRDTLGLRLKFESPDGVHSKPAEQRSRCMPLLGQRQRGRDPGRAHGGDMFAGLLSGGPQCTYAELGERGARFVMPPTEQEIEGIRLAVCIDPDGLAIWFAEPLAREATGPA